jgi:hypothetical protein
MTISVLYFEECTWEVDFILNDILGNIKKKVEFFNKENFDLFLNREDIVKNNILIINYWINFDRIINIIKFIEPIAIFYLSDEHGNKSWITSLEKYTKVLFTQYNHAKYIYSNKIYQLPLGYSRYYLDGKKTFDIQNKTITERNINCSFIGTNKSDRIHMSNIFKSNMEKTNFIFVENTWDFNNLPTSPKDCFDIYSNSIFVAIGRGYISLDCFRIYEAIAAGAIPIIVGDIDEIQTTFNYNNNIPPFIYSNSWENALIICNNYLKNTEKLNEIQRDLILWWNNKLLFINDLIKANLP